MVVVLIYQTEEHCNVRSLHSLLPWGVADDGLSGFRVASVSCPWEHRISHSAPGSSSCSRSSRCRNPNMYVAAFLRLLHVHVGCDHCISVWLNVWWMGGLEGVAGSAREMDGVGVMQWSERKPNWLTDSVASLEDYLFCIFSWGEVPLLYDLLLWHVIIYRRITVWRARKAPNGTNRVGMGTGRNGQNEREGLNDTSTALSPGNG